MPYCTACGGQVAENANFCTHCGKASNGVAVAPTAGMPGDKEARINLEWSDLAPKDWGDKKHADERAMLSGLLEDDEHLGCLVSGDFNPEGKLPHINLGVATDRRLIFLRQTKRTPEVVSLYYDTIESISFKTGWMGGSVKVTSRHKGGYQMESIKPKEWAKLLAETVQPHLTDEPVAVEEPVSAATDVPVSVVVSKAARIEQEWATLAPMSWDSKKHANEREMLPGLLAHDELMECLVSGSFKNTDWGGSNTNLGIATDRRVVFLRKTRRSSEVLEMSFDAISHISSNTNGDIEVSAQGKGRFAMQGIRPKEQAQAFVVAIQPRIAVAQEGKPPPESKEDRIDREWNDLVPNGWGNFKNKVMLSGERSMLYRLLEDDEHLECLVGGKCGPDLGRSHIARDKSLHSVVGVATDRRVIFVDSGIASAEVAEMPYTSIETISYSSGISLAGLKISARGSTALQMEMIRSMGEAKLFADAVRKHLNAGQAAGTTVVQTASAMDELEKAAALYERGLLTQEEFEAKKAQLLNS